MKAQPNPRRNQVKRKYRAGPVLAAMDLSSLVSDIYQGPLENPPWQTFIYNLRVLTNCDVAALTVRPGSTGTSQLFVWDWASEEVKTRYLEGARLRVQHSDPLGTALTKPGQVLMIDDVIPRSQLKKSDFYLKLMKPYQLEHQVGMYFSEPSGWRCNVGLNSGPQKRKFGAREKEILSYLHPHLERALALYARIVVGESEKELFEDTLDRLTIGLFILDGRGRVITSNAIAQQTLRNAKDIFLVDGKLGLRSAANNAQLSQLISRALGQRQTLPETFVDMLTIQREDGSNLNLLVRSVTLKNAHRSDATPGIVIYLEDSTRQKMPAEQFVARLFGYTPAEANLATLLANGLTLTEAGAKLKLTESTVRSYAKRVFAKAGVNRQADLVRLILKSVILLA